MLYPAAIRKKMKIAILGSGSLGSTFGGILTEAGLDVTLVNRPNEHMKVLREQGLTLVEESVARLVKVKVATDPRQIEPVDLIVVLVKSSFTRTALEGFRSLIGTETLAMSLQNGLGNEEILREYLGESRVLSGRTYVGGALIAPGLAQIGVKGRETLIGELDGHISERAQQIGALFNRAGLETRVISDLQELIWQKLLINVSGGAICGITGLSYGQLLQVPEAVACAVAAVQEAIDVGRAAGVNITATDPKAVLDKAAAGLPFDFKPSILQDIERRRSTEIDFINGAVVRLGEKLAIATPVNRTLVAGIKGIERRFAKD
jgi:2-dehydropantoate 2-reductase